MSDPDTSDYSVLNAADLDLAATILEGLADEVARSGAGRKKANEVEAAAQAVRLALEIITDLYKTVRARDSGSGPEGENSRSEVEGEARQSGLSASEGIARTAQPSEKEAP